ncbi:MAG: hypothetical protein JW384_02833 [Nitrosomonadaceae bacterium]|nr:hypothetical protein [Nitrosomonadaceae bacterium]
MIAYIHLDVFTIESRQCIIGLARISRANSVASSETGQGVSRYLMKSPPSGGKLTAVVHNIMTAYISDKPKSLHVSSGGSGD